MSQDDFPDIRVAIVGAGLMGRWHAHAAHKLGAKITAIVDSNPDATAPLAQKYPEAATFADISRLLDNEKIDAVHICTPPESHNAIVSEVLGRAVHVLVEKPVTPSAGQTRQLLQLAAEQGVLLCPVHQFAFQRSQCT